MRTYTVHAPPDAAAEPERFVFVKDGFSWPALFVPILWIFWRRLWLTLVWYVVFLLVVAWAGRLAGDGNATILALLGGLLLAFEANDIRRRSLDSRGWLDLGPSAGDNLEEAEIRFLERRRAASAPPMRQETIIRPFYLPDRGFAGEERVLGLFPEAER